MAVEGRHGLRRLFRGIENGNAPFVEGPDAPVLAAEEGTHQERFPVSAGHPDQGFEIRLRERDGDVISQGEDFPGDREDHIEEARVHDPVGDHPVDLFVLEQDLRNIPGQLGHIEIEGHVNGVPRAGVAGDKRPDGRLRRLGKLRNVQTDAVQGVRRRRPGTARVRDDGDPFPPEGRLGGQGERRTEDLLDGVDDNDPRLGEKTLVNERRTGDGPGMARSRPGPRCRSPHVLGDDGLLPADPSRRLQEGGRPPDPFDVQADGLGFLVFSKIIQTVHDVDVRLVPHAHALAEDDAVAVQPGQVLGDEGAALGRHAQSHSPVAGGKDGQVQRICRVQDSHAVGSEESDPVLPGDADDLVLQFLSAFPRFAETGADDHGVFRSEFAELPEHVGHQEGGHDEDRNVGNLGKGVDGRIRLLSQDFLFRWVNGEDPPGITAPDEVETLDRSHFHDVVARPDDGDGFGVHDFVQRIHSDGLLSRSPSFFCVLSIPPFPLPSSGKLT